jgi:hypothetical protein
LKAVSNSPSLEMSVNRSRVDVAGFASAKERLVVLRQSLPLAALLAVLLGVFERGEHGTELAQGFPKLL